MWEQERRSWVSCILNLRCPGDYWLEFQAGHASSLAVHGLGSQRKGLKWRFKKTKQTKMSHQHLDENWSKSTEQKAQYLFLIRCSYCMDPTSEWKVAPHRRLYLFAMCNGQLVLPHSTGREVPAPLYLTAFQQQCGPIGVPELQPLNLYSSQQEEKVVQFSSYQDPL